VISFKISWKPPDIDKWEFEYPCPKCRLSTIVTLGQARYEEYFICRGCHSTIKIIDHFGDVQHIKQSLEGLFK
jgi:hypothetical protein